MCESASLAVVIGAARVNTNTPVTRSPPASGGWSAVGGVVLSADKTVNLVTRRLLFTVDRPTAGREVGNVNHQFNLESDVTTR